MLMMMFLHTAIFLIAKMPIKFITKFFAVIAKEDNVLSAYIASKDILTSFFSMHTDDSYIAICLVVLFIYACGIVMLLQTAILS